MKADFSGFSYSMVNRDARTIGRCLFGWPPPLAPVPPACFAAARRPVWSDRGDAGVAPEMGREGRIVTIVHRPEAYSLGGLDAVSN
jgi:hypothetical protein